jgi:hypothetical protein
MIKSRFAAIFLRLPPVFALFLFTLSSGINANGGWKTLPGHVPAAVARLNPGGRLPATNDLDLAIGLPLRNPVALDKLLQELYDPASTNFHRYLTPVQFSEQFGPTEQDYQRVVQFARSNGFSIRHEHGNRVLLDVRGKVANIEKALHVTLRTYRHPTEARNFFAPDTEPSLDSQLPVSDVSGLSDYSQLRPKSWRQEITAHGKLEPQGGSGMSGAYLGDDFRNAYAPGTVLTGAGQMVGLVQFDGYYTNDIATYATLAGGGRTNIVVEKVLVDGFSGLPSDTNGNAEVSLDIEMAMAMAPGLSKIMVFEAPNSQGYFNDVLNAMAAHYQVKNLSCSWGGGGPNATSETIFKQMAAQGQSFFNASGDSDAFTGLVPFPSDSPSITQVGGTTLTMNGQGDSYVSETVWNWGYVAKHNQYIGSSGGISTTYAIPSWQQAVNMASNSGSSTMRNIPDVALTADNVLVYYGNGTNGNFGGTSCAAPLWAGFMALVNQQAVAMGRAPVGFANPSIYAIAQGTNYSICFNDTTSGNNFSSNSPTQFAATAGYDLCTGWGTPVGTNFINALAGLAETLVISPDGGFGFSATNNRPFNVNSQTFSLANSGSAAVSWQLNNVPAWLTAQPASGSLAAGGQTNVTISVNLVSSNLAVGTYHAGLLFSNVTTSVTQLRSVDLAILNPTIVQNGGFETGDFTGWTLVGNGQIGTFIYNAVVSAYTFGNFSGYLFVHSGTYGAFLGDSPIATLSQTLNTVPGQRYLLSFWLSNPETGPGQQFKANWITNSSGTNLLFSLSNPPVITWTNPTFVVTATATNTVLQFGAANPPDGFGLDDVVVVPIPAPTVTSVIQNSNTFAFMWHSLAGVSYQAQYKTNLLQSDWLPLDTITATNNITTVMDTNAVSSSPQRFYRIVEFP